MIEETRTDHAFESLSAAEELAGMIHRHFAEQAMMDRPNELKQARGESLSYALRSLIQSALVDLEKTP